MMIVLQHGELNRTTATTKNQTAFWYSIDGILTGEAEKESTRETTCIPKPCIYIDLIFCIFVYLALYLQSS